MIDTIDILAKVAPGSFLDTLRRRKPITRDNAQASFDALFQPASFGGVSAGDRAALAVFIAGLHEDASAMAFYGARFMQVAPASDVAAALQTEVTLAAAQGPYGSYPPGPLAAEDQPGPTYQVSATSRPALGGKLSAALEHAHMLVFHLRDASPEALRTLEAAGWSADDIVTISQLVAFLSFQLRAAAGLRALDTSRSTP